MAPTYVKVLEFASFQECAIFKVLKINTAMIHLNTTFKESINQVPYLYYRCTFCSLMLVYLQQEAHEALRCTHLMMLL